MKMSARQTFYKEYLKQWLNRSNFKLLVLILICINIYGTAYLAYNTDYIDGIFRCFSNSYYTTSILFLTLISTMISVQLFDKNLFYIIRFKTRKEYLRQLIHNILISNTILFFVNLLLMIIGLNLFSGTQFEIYSFQNYEVSNIIYLIFFLFRIYLMIQCFGIINILLFKLIHSKMIVVIINIVALLPSFTLVTVLNENIQSLNQMFFYFIEYFVIHHYSSFSLEILCSSIYMLAILIVIIFLFRVTRIKMKEIGE